MKSFNDLLDTIDFRSSGKWILLASMVGVVVGLGALAFDVLGQLVVRYSLAEFAGYVPAEADGEHAWFRIGETNFQPWLIVVVMAVGGLLSGTLVYSLAPEAEGAGTDAALDAFHNQRGVIRARIPLIKTVASAITLGTGGSGGREGPIAQIGAGLGSLLAQRIGLSARDRRVMLAVGMGAGVGAIFRAPLAGAVFAGEILYSDADLEADVILPAATASIVAYSVYTQALPPDTRFEPLFGSELSHTFASPLELLPYIVLAVVVLMVGILYVRVVRTTRDVFQNLPVVPHVRPAIGAGLAGIVGVSLFQLWGQNPALLGVLGTGYGVLQQALGAASELSVTMLITIAMVKILTTALTVSSGGSGGVFAPSMVIGGCIGAACGQGLYALAPGFIPDPEAFAVVGMAGFFAGVARAPISTIIMVRALTGDFGLLVPTMLVCTLSFVCSRQWKLYERQVPTRMDSPAHVGDFLIDVLEGLKVRDVYQQGRKLTLINEGETMEDIVHKLARNRQHYFPVVDSEGRMVGIFSDDDVRTYLYDDTLWKLAVARDVMITDIVSVSPDDDLNSALKRFTARNLDELPVLDPDEPGKLLGMLRRKETIAAYNQRLMEHKQAVDED